MDFKSMAMSSMVAAGIGIGIVCLNNAGNWSPELTVSIMIGSCIIWGCCLIAYAIHEKNVKSHENKEKSS